MKKYLALFVLSILFMTFSTYAIEYPQFRSAISTTGITANFDTVYSKADKFETIVEHDAKGIVWNYKDTGNWVIMKDDGTVVIAGPSAFSLGVKNALNSDLDRVKKLIQSTGGNTPKAPLIYYADDPYLYRGTCLAPIKSLKNSLRIHLDQKN